jgi:hypothetical protein
MNDITVTLQTNQLDVAISFIQNVESESPMNSITINADENIQSFQVITADGKRADSNNLSHRGKVVGIAKSNTNTGFNCPVITSGEVVNPVWTWTEGQIIFLNGNELSATPPQEGWLQQIAIAKNATTIVVEILNPYLL